MTSTRRGRLVLFLTGGVPVFLRGLEVSMTPVSEESGMGLPSKQRNGFKVHSLSKEQASGKEMIARSKNHDNERADFA